MTTHTTFETSRLLAENGFPQPEFQPGQFWHSRLTKQSYVVSFPEGRHGRDYVTMFCLGGVEWAEFILPQLGRLVFTPTVSDIFNWMKSICQEKKDPRIYHEWKGIFMNALESDIENTVEAVALAAISFIGDK